MRIGNIFKPLRNKSLVGLVFASSLLLLIPLTLLSLYRDNKQVDRTYAKMGGTNNGLSADAKIEYICIQPAYATN